MGGISKDDVGSSHGSLHHTAADLAVNATMELLEDIKAAVGDKNFLRYESFYDPKQKEYRHGQSRTAAELCSLRE